MVPHTLPTASAGLSDTRLEVAFPDTGNLPAWLWSGPVVAPLPDEVVLTEDEEREGPAVERMQAYFAALGYTMSPWVNAAGAVTEWTLDRRTGARPKPSFFKTPGEVWQWWHYTACDQLHFGRISCLVFSHFQRAPDAERTLMRRWLATTFDTSGKSGWRETFKALERRAGTGYTTTLEAGWSTHVAVFELAGVREAETFRDRLVVSFDEWEIEEQRMAIDAACSPADFSRDTRRL